MKDLAPTSRILASDIRRAEQTVTAAARDTTQLLLSMFDGSIAHPHSPAVLHPTIKATLAALSSLVESQQHLALRAHPHLERAGTALGLTVVDWGEGYPKPMTAAAPDASCTGEAPNALA
jgi:hypothetical protein